MPSRDGSCCEMLCCWWGLRNNPLSGIRTAGILLENLDQLQSPVWLARATKESHEGPPVARNNFHQRKNYRRREEFLLWYIPVVGKCLGRLLRPIGIWMTAIGVEVWLTGFCQTLANLYKKTIFPRIRWHYQLLFAYWLARNEEIGMKSHQIVRKQCDIVSRLIFQDAHRIDTRISQVKLHFNEWTNTNIAS